MSVFHGNWNEDLKDFLNSYLQDTANTDSNFKAWHFINYLGANSDADEWFDKLPKEEKKDWAAIELSFHKRWLKEEVLSINKTATIANEPKPAFTQPTSTTSSITTVSMQTNPITGLSISYLTSGTQASYLDTILHTMTNCSIQTNPISTQTSCHVIGQPPSLSTLSQPLTQLLWQP